MDFDQTIPAVRWHRIATLAEHTDARAWLTFQACRGRAINTLEAYGRNLDRYLRFLASASAAKRISATG